KLNSKIKCSLDGTIYCDGICINEIELSFNNSSNVLNSVLLKSGNEIILSDKIKIFSSGAIECNSLEIGDIVFEDLNNDFDESCLLIVDEFNIVYLICLKIILHFDDSTFILDSDNI